MNKASWILQVIVAKILLQTLYFKFTAHPDNVYIFSTLGMEPFGRIASGVAELVTGILLLIPGTVWLGALGSIGIMCSALFRHLTVLGINVNNDGGSLFLLADIAFLGGIIILIVNRKQIPVKLPGILK